MGLERVVSGGQSGVDRATLDVCIALGIEIGGWCPKGRWAEDGTISSHYPLIETDCSNPAVRTKLNVRDSDGTLVLYEGTLCGGTDLTVKYAKDIRRPLLVVPLDQELPVELAVSWIQQHVHVLNVAGPRESEC